MLNRRLCVSFVCWHSRARQKQRHLARLRRAIQQLEHAAMLRAFRLWLAEMWSGRDSNLEMRTFQSLEVLRETMLEHAVGYRLRKRKRTHH